MEKYYKFENGLILKAEFQNEEDMKVGQKYRIGYDEDESNEDELLELVAIANELHELDYTCYICGDIDNLEVVENAEGFKVYVCSDCLNGEV